MGSIKDIFEFAEQPLKEAIKARFKLDLDVRNVYLARKYAYRDRDDLYGFLVFDQQEDRSLRYEYRGISLLEAALANFEPNEEQPLRCNDCQIITGWNSYDGEVLPTFQAVNSQVKPIAPHDFARLCRELDLGTLYQKHIKDIVRPKDAVEREVLERQLEEHHRQGLAVSVEIAWLQSSTRPGSHQVDSGISHDVYQMLRRSLNNEGDVTLDGKPVTFSALKAFGIELVGPLLIGPSRKAADRVERLVVYLPNDPLQPLKEYASSADFMEDLRTRLHSSAYRHFFSQFIPQRQQGVFFTQFNRLYNPTSLDSRTDYPMQVWPASLPLDEVSIDGDLWKQLRLQLTDKLLTDARAIAVPTGDEDRRAREERLASYLDAVISVFNLAAFVVPGLGPIMLVVGAVQMLDEAFEGIEAYEEGDVPEMWAHFSSVALNVAFIGTGAVVLPSIQLSTRVDTLKPVTLASGKQKLWKPDLSPYKAPITLAAEARPDELGLYMHNGQTVLPIEGDVYSVRQVPGSDQYRIQHPTRAEAYTPEVEHNGEGAWRHELERPLTWDGVRLMRRLGPMVDGFSDIELEQIRQVSGVDTDILRRLHVEGEPVPAVMLDTLKRFGAYGDAVKVARGIAEGSLSSALCSYVASLAVELPGWPAGKAIEAFSGDGLNGPSVKYGSQDALPQNILKMSRSQLMTGRLPAKIIEFLNEAGIKGLLPTYTPRTSEARISALQKQLQERAIGVRARLMRSLYAEQQPEADAAVAIVQRDFTGLPTLIIRELLVDATPIELSTLNSTRRIPLRLAERARRLQQQMRLNRAYEGLYLDALIEKDSEVLAVNSLKAIPGWVNDLRLEIREGGLEGVLRASVGDVQASERKVLVRVGEGRYEARNDRDEHLHGIDDLYSSIQHALPDRSRQAIGLPHTHQGMQLKAKIIEHRLPRDQLRTLFGMQPRHRPFFKSPMRLSGERIGYPLSDHPRTSQWREIVEERVRTLYPSMSPAQINAFIESMGNSHETILRNREREYKQLDHTLQNWQRAQMEGVSERQRQTPDFARRRRARMAIFKALKQAWQRTGEVDLDINGLPQGQFINLSNVDLEGQLNELPPLSANFDHVTHLDLSGAGIDIDVNVDGFLRHFRRLRRLNLSNNDMSELPASLGRMSRLVELDLSDNLIELDPSAVARLRGLTRLQFLGLEGNPLQLLPDIGQMPDLNILLLADTGLNAWPVGVFDQYRGRTFNLDLSANVLEHIPEVVPGSDEAEVVARTTISLEPEYISEQNLQIVRGYRQSVGIEPDRPYPPRGMLDSIHWKAGLSNEQWQAKQDIWEQLEDEPNSEPFFRELRKLAQSADALATQEAAKVELCRKVWEMIDAAAANSELRETLFRLAAAPTTCVDAGAQLFNAMGLEVLIFQAYELAAHDLIETALLELARGKSRLDELGRIARERIGELLSQGRQFPEFDEQELVVPHRDAQGRVIPDIDEVEIHMIYPTRLAQRLELPWQSRKMMFRVPDVTPEMIKNAHDRVLEKERGTQLQERIIDQPFWVDYLKRSSLERFKAVYDQAEIALDLQAAQQAWLDSDSAVHKIYWRTEIVRLAKQLGLPDSEVTPGSVMSNEQYYVQMEKIAAQEKALVATLTREAMTRARLSRQDIPFTLEDGADPQT
ncbi:NEL-type E3 ubiquitin ligase domain-containing protein [Pseudomonas putida]|uniref:NEL-type E3 ubiquitin ligase domain-containing protein n=1 Tax=Pseudomonas putida TaxID=303 RepID=UPI003D98AC73